MISLQKRNFSSRFQTNHEKILANLPKDPVKTSKATAKIVINPAQPELVTLYLDDWESSCLDLTDPSYLEFEYLQHMRIFIRIICPSQGHFCHIGGAGCALPRALVSDFPNCKNLVLEYDELLAKYVREWFDIPRSPNLRIRCQEGIEALSNMPSARWDALIIDAFTNGMVPAPILSQETFTLAEKVLKPNGIFLINLVDKYPLPTVREVAKHLQNIFPNVLGVSDPAIWKGKRFGNVVIVASKSEYDLESTPIERELRRLSFPATVKTKF